MKRLLCAVMALILVFTAAVFTANADDGADDQNLLIVTVDGADPTPVEVGNEFIFFVGLDAGSVKLLNGQARLYYDPEYLSFVPHTAGEDDTVECYSFPPAVYSSSIVFNKENYGFLSYNFSRASGVRVFNDTKTLFVRFRFKATAPGHTDMSYVIQFMKNINEQCIYYDGEPDATINPQIAVTLDVSEGLIGDADGDGIVTIFDATYIQRVAAGYNLSCSVHLADLSGDDAVSLGDALILRKYLAGMTVTSPVDTRYFASEANK